MITKCFKIMLVAVALTGSTFLAAGDCRILPITKAQQWEFVAGEVDTWTDALGMPIDENIKELVVALNIYEVPTYQSCEGHLDHGSPFPWIHFNFEIPEFEIMQEKMKAFSQQENVSEEDWKEFHVIRERAQEKTLAMVKPIKDQLDLFYTERSVNSDHMIILEGSMGYFELRANGSYFQYVQGSKEKKAKLSEYQAEMQAFASFLKENYLK